MNKNKIIFFNSFLLFYVFIFCSSINSVGVARECSTPTEYIMKFLRNSTTLWFGSKQWKNQIAPLKAGESIHTAYAKTHLVEYSGLSARLFSCSLIPETSVSSFFSISKNSQGSVVVESTIEDTMVKQATTKKEKEDAIEHVAESSRGIRRKVSDHYGECIITSSVSFNETTGQVVETRSIKCKHTFSDIKYFMQQIFKTDD